MHEFYHVIPGLEDVMVIKTEQLAGQIVLYVEMEARSHTCVVAIKHVRSMITKLHLK